MTNFTGRPSPLWDFTAERVAASKRGVEEVEAMSKRGASQQELLAKLHDIHKGTAVPVYVLPSGSLIHRVVRWDTRPASVNLIGRKPASLVAEPGRVNAEGESVFYASLFSATACLYECHASVGELFVIGRWKLSEDLPLACFGYSDPEVSKIRRRRQGYVGLVDWNTGRELDEFLTAWHSKIFTTRRESGLYALTRALSAAALGSCYDPTKRNAPFQGVLYPSRATELFGENVALPALVADRALGFEHCSYVRVEGTDVPASGEPHITYGTIDVCSEIAANGELVWRSAFRSPLKSSFSTFATNAHRG